MVQHHLPPRLLRAPISMTPGRFGSRLEGQGSRREGCASSLEPSAVSCAHVVRGSSVDGPSGIENALAQSERAILVT